MTYTGPDRRKKNGTVLDRADYNYSGGNILRAQGSSENEGRLLNEDFQHQNTNTFHAPH